MKPSTFVGKLIGKAVSCTFGIIWNKLFPKKNRSKSPSLKRKTFKPGYSSGSKYQTRPKDWTPKER